MGKVLAIGSTPIITFNVPFDPTTLAACRVVFKGRESVLLEKNLNELTISATETGGQISFKMTQEETLLFPDRTTAQIQLHIRDMSGNAAVSKPIPMETSILLKREVV